ncbi:ScbR family autoregulator-binding transcription factor [Rothia halotolerans]|uniref:ScbR family autoregulator-binding transcription factor n=1 Tax=Rothia halotolerans TaxID=405770 RepID=UPI0013ECA7DE|nr:ScbR family autoregulator-binding transcription factor [Rothia halotolerans]
MTRRHRQPAQERGKKTQDAILAGAAAAFQESGFAGASLSKISALSGISQGSMYFHFKSKEQIALAVMHEQHVRTYQKIENAREETADPFEQMIRTSRALCGLLAEDDVVRAGMELTLENNALREESYAFYDRWFSRVEAILEHAREDGILVTPLASAELSRSMVGYFTGSDLVCRSSQTESDLLASIEVMWVVIVSAVIAEDRREEYLGICRELFRAE